MFQCMIKLRRTKEALKKLNRSEFLNIQCREAEARLSLEEAQTNLSKEPLSIHLQQQEQYCMEQYGVLKKAYFSFLFQKARLQWLKEGDMNIAFFFMLVLKGEGGVITLFH